MVAKTKKDSNEFVIRTELVERKGVSPFREDGLVESISVDVRVVLSDKAAAIVEHQALGLTELRHLVQYASQIKSTPLAVPLPYVPRVWDRQAFTMRTGVTGAFVMVEKHQRVRAVGEYF